MKDTFLKMAGVKSEKEFYKKYPTEDHFFAEHGAALGMPKMEFGGISQYLPKGYDDPMPGPSVPATAPYSDGVLVNPSTTPGLQQSVQAASDRAQGLTAVKPAATTAAKPAATGAGYDYTGVAGSVIPAAMAMFDKDASSGQKGSAIGGGIGAAAGSIFGPAGTAIGSQLGSAVGGLIGGGADDRRNKRKYMDMQNKRFNKLNLSYNANPYGTDDSFYAAEGGQPDESSPQEATEIPQEQADDSPKPTKVNIEKGELGVDPKSMEVIRTFKNKNRYSAHADNPMKEAIGNHVVVPDNMIIIPKRMAKRYENGNKLTRRSILANLLKDQVNREHAEQPGAPMRPGGRAGDNDPLSPFSEVYDGQQYFPKDPTVATAREPYPAVGMPNLTGMPNAGMTTPIAPEDQDWETPDPTEVHNGLQLPSLRIPKAPYVSPVAVSRVATAIPTLYGLHKAAGSDPYLNYNENDNYGQAAAMLEQMPTDINIEPAKAAMARSANSYARQLFNTNSPSIRAENAANFSKVIDAQGKLYGDADNERKTRIASKLQGLSSLRVAQGDNQERARDRFTQALEQDKANREGLVQKGLSEFGTNYAKSVMDDERVKAINTLSKYFQLTPMQKQLLQQNPDALSTMYSETMGGNAVYPAANPTATTPVQNTTPSGYVATPPNAVAASTWRGATGPLLPGTFASSSRARRGTSTTKKKRP